MKNKDVKKVNKGLKKTNLVPSVFQKALIEMNDIRFVAWINVRHGHQGKVIETYQEYQTGMCKI